MKIIKTPKLKVIIVIVFLFFLLAYYTWPIAIVYVITDIGKNASMKITPQPFLELSSKKIIQTNSKTRNFGLVEARINIKDVIKETQVADNAINIEYANYNFLSSSIELVVDSRMSFNAVKYMYETTPSDLISINSYKKNLALLANLIRKYTFFGPEPDKVEFVEVFNKHKIKGFAYMYQWDESKPRISISVYGGDQDMQWFEFESKSNDTSVIKEQYRAFITTAKGV